jgi:chorismate mutase/prephenate dehydratase
MSRKMTKPTLSSASADQPTVAADPALEALRAEIDSADTELLALIQRRLDLARRIGAAKAGGGDALKIRPDREAALIARQCAKAAPEARRLTEAVWRELMSGGLAAQNPIEVVVWSGRRNDVRDGARGRFGGCADYRDARTPEDALDAAQGGSVVAVLALEPETPWWVDLPARNDLWIFEGLGRRGALEPTALAIGRVEASTLARGVAYRVNSGGDSDLEGRSERLLAFAEGRRLYAAKERGTGSLDRNRGMVGAAAL